MTVYTKLIHFAPSLKIQNPLLASNFWNMAENSKYVWEYYVRVGLMHRGAADTKVL